MEQGSTSVNGPHQGGYVETENGEGWFLHFSQRGGYGRILYLEPVQWKDGWPIIGKPVSGTTYGEPVSSWTRPSSGGNYPIETPQASDEFNDVNALGLQWEWNHNPDDSNWSLKERPGFLRLKASYAPDLIHARNTLTQQMQHQDFDLTAKIDVSAMKDGERAGLAIFGKRPSWIGIVQVNGTRRIVYENGEGESEVSKLLGNAVLFQMHVEDEHVSYLYSTDGGLAFLSAGSANPFVFSWWKASRPALFTFSTRLNAPFGAIDIDWVRCHSLAGNASISRFK